MFQILPKLPRPIVAILIGLWRRRWLILGVGWVLAVAGWLAIGTLPDMYQSRAQVYINTDTALDTTIEEIGARPNLEKGVRIIRTQLLSRDNIEQVIYEAGLDAVYQSPSEFERLIDRLADSIEIDSEEDQYYVIRYDHQDPVVAQRVVSAVQELFIEQNLSNAMGGVETAILSLDRELKTRQRELDEIDSRIATFRRLNATELAGSNRIGRQLEAREDELGRIQDQIALAVTVRSRTQAALASTPRYSSGSDLDALKLQLASLQSQFNDNYPDIVRLKAQIVELESGSAALPTNPAYREALAGARQAQDELDALKISEQRIIEEIDRLTVDMAQTPEAETRLVSLERQREQIESTYKQLAGERAQMSISADLSQAGGAIEYRVFEAAKVASEPNWPPRGLFVIIAMILALGVGAGIAFLLTQLDKTYTQTSDLENAFGLPVLGSISPAPSPLDRNRRLIERASFASIAGALIVSAMALFYWYEIRVAGDTTTQTAAYGAYDDRRVR